ncbi:MAG: class I SAM-dependent methyltransferase [Hyphomicrobiales bacterium]|nr:class I SAM-dependent methyltransferase [Hyphomicrobiales bacterium]
MRPVESIPYAVVEVSGLADPIPAIIADPAFATTTRWFAQEPAGRSQLSPEAQALLFTLTRNLKPAHVFEIGTFLAGTSEAICRALHANGTGLLHTTDPFSLAAVPAILMKWPRELRRHVKFYHLDSMAFFMRMEQAGIRSQLTFIDGRHDYQFAMFDLSMAARTLDPGGMVLLDNVSQPGPYLAALDFQRDTPGWRECGNPGEPRHDGLPFDNHRARIHNSDLIALRAPFALVVGARPVMLGERGFDRQEVRGIELRIAERSSRGTLTIQCALRGHSASPSNPGVEIIGATSLDLDGAQGPVTARFKTPLVARGEFYQMALETALVWRGEAPLTLAGPPVFI